MNVRMVLSVTVLLVLSVMSSKAQRRSEYYPITYWDFPFSESADSVDCIFNNENMELFISGFDTDGKGTFYFAGGHPLRVSCFKGQKLQWRREVSDTCTHRGLLRLLGDSLYLVQDLRRELIIMNKDGKGDVRHVSLAVDSVFEGVMNDNHIVISGCPQTVKGDIDERYEVSYFNYQGTLLRRDNISLMQYRKEMRPDAEFYDRLYEWKGIGRLSDSLSPGDYKGMYDNTELFVFGGGSCFVLNRPGPDGHPWMYELRPVDDKDLFFDILPLEVLTDNIDAWLHTNSPELFILRGTHVYYVGFEYDNCRRIIVTEFDLDRMFPDSKTKRYGYKPMEPKK